MSQMRGWGHQNGSSSFSHFILFRGQFERKLSYYCRICIDAQMKVFWLPNFPTGSQSNFELVFCFCTPWFVLTVRCQKAQNMCSQAFLFIAMAMPGLPYRTHPRDAHYGLKSEHFLFSEVDLYVNRFNSNLWLTLGVLILLVALILTWSGSEVPLYIRWCQCHSLQVDAINCKSKKSKITAHLTWPRAAC